MTSRSARRRLKSAIMTAVIAGLCFAAVAPLLFIFGNLVAKGASSIDWNFFVKNPVPAGSTGGGVAHASRCHSSNGPEAYT